MPEDAYRAAAVDLPGREAAAIAGGVTRERYQDEATGLREAAAATRSVPERAELIAEAENLEARVARMSLSD